jgi:hypothetical protein
MEKFSISEATERNLIIFGILGVYTRSYLASNLQLYLSLQTFKTDVGLFEIKTQPY